MTQSEPDLDPADDPARWPLLVALLSDPDVESRRLIEQLARWLLPRRRQRLLDRDPLASQNDEVPT